MKIIHKTKKIHQNANELFRLFTKSDSNICLSVAIIFDENNFLKKIAEKLFADRAFEKIFKKLKNQIEKTKNKDEKSATEYQSYRLDDETRLFYLRNKPYFERICISEKCQKKLFQYDHDQHAHDEMHRIYDLLVRSVFISKMRKLITEYVINCSVCQLSKPFRQFSYGEFQSIFQFSKSLCELNFDFIVTLPLTSLKHNVMLTIIDRFFKYIKTVSEKEIMSAIK